MRKTLAIVFGMLVGVLALVGCGNTTKAVNTNKLQVVASFYPMAEFTRQVGGDKVEVRTMVADGVEPHDWEPTAKDLGQLSQAQLFIYNGGVEPWAAKALEAVQTKGVVGVEAGHGLLGELMETAGHGHEHVGVDPHVWVSPKQAIQEVRVIKEALSKADAANKAFYEKNAQNYIAQLTKLDEQLQALGQKAVNKKFVTTHAAFGHLAKDYGLEQVPIMGVSPDAEPSPADLKSLVEIIKTEKIPYVFFETLVSPKVAETIAEASGAKTLVLDPIEGLSKENKEKNKNYVLIMEENIKNLKLALGVK